MPLADIIQFVGLGKKTGVLRVENGSRRKSVAFRDGDVVFCSSGSPKEYLGQQLLARTGLSEAQLAAAFEEQERSGRPLGEVLVSRGHLSSEDIHAVLAQKIEDSLHEIFAWDSGAFSFDEQPLSAAVAPVQFALFWQDVILEGCRRADEMTRIRELIPGPDVRFHALKDRFPSNFPRTGGDKKLIELVDAGLSAGQICPRFHASDFDILARLRKLVLEGILEVDAESEAEARISDSSRELMAARRLVAAGSLVEALDALRAGMSAHPSDKEFGIDLCALEADMRTTFERLGGLDTVPSIEGGLERLTRMTLSSKQAFIVTRINGSWSVRTIAQLCPFDEIDVMGTLVQLARQGVLTLQVLTAVLR